MNRADFRRGVRDVAPLLLGVAPFGLVAGIAAANAGLDLTQAVGMSVIVFAGASQLAALDLIGRDAPLSVVVLTAVVINLRMLMYSASIAPYFRTFAARVKAGLAYLLTDQAYALSIASYRAEASVDRVAYYLGVAVTLWVVWQLTTAAGVLLGTGVPDAWGLEFAVPLVFLALLVPAMEDGPTTVAGLVGGTVAVAGAGLPLNLGLLVGASVGIVAGLLAERPMEVNATDGH
ncbi:AzlC family ABC transporter permease [Halorientalis regularis]|uniref:4-azaleucine resistance probable transporter AzlC n=1 Tax=Halorientalis regularis TaxID=660518 RepID=A0A1G7K755_9EURY|nr:AzlC family ABC transporter permease [Halorientalis regularis]SDF32957.1 4-azaleucine resistance probable transporter AzlC [Halorientalis regularis]